MQAKILEKFDKFAKGLNSKDRVALFTDYDSDGLAAGALAFKAVEKITGRKPALTLIAQGSDRQVSRKMVNELKKARINKFICLDISLDQKAKAKIAESIAKFASVLNFDHHKVYGSFKSKNALLVKPQFFSKKDPSAYPASKMCFDLFSRACDLKENAWIAAVGIYGDYAEREWESFFKKALKNAGISRERIIELSNTIAAVKAVDGSKINECLKELIEKEPKNALKKFGKFKKVLDSILKKEEASFWKNAECFKQLEYCFYYSKSRFNIAGSLINRISKELPKTTIIIIHKAANGEIGLHARRQDRKVAVNDLLEKAVKGLKNANAGGHVPAAGGRIQAKDLQKFKKNVLGILKEKYKK